ncbi:hypothetical protein D3C84_912870 [compost metagenome]
MMCPGQEATNRRLLRKLQKSLLAMRRLKPHKRLSPRQKNRRCLIREPRASMQRLWGWMTISKSPVPTCTSPRSWALVFVSKTSRAKLWWCCLRRKNSSGSCRMRHLSRSMAVTNTVSKSYDRRVVASRLSMRGGECQRPPQRLASDLNSAN